MSEDVLKAGVQAAANYIASRPNRPVHPAIDEIEGLAAFDEPMPQHGMDPTAVIELLDAVGSPGTVQTNGPRYFGFVTGGALPVARAAAALGSAWDQNGALSTMSPTAAAIDLVTTRWVGELLGLQPTATGVFCGGASEANLISLIAARDEVLSKAGWDAQNHGLIGAPEVTVVVSAEAHVSLIKAIGLAGLGRKNVTTVPSDSQGCINIEELAKLKTAGPTILCLQAGNVNTGHSDNFTQAIAWAKANHAWTHIDGAFGIWAAASPALAHQVEGHELADSWALDCHKWLNVPYDSAIAYVADGSSLSNSFGANAAYIGSDVPRAPMHLGLQMSQRARAIDTWAVLKHLGRDGVAQLIDSSCQLATRFAQQLKAGGAAILHEVVLNQLLVSFGDDERTDAVVERVQQAGVCWVGPTTWKNQRAMRVSISGAETTEADVDAAVASILESFDSTHNLSS